MSKLKPYFVVFAAATFFLFEFINLNSFDALNDVLRHYYQVSALEISNVSAMYFYANILLLIPAGIILDRFSIKRSLILVFFICILATLAFTWSQSIHTAMIMRFIIGGGATLCLLSTAKLTSRWFPPSHTAFVMGLVVTMAMVGGVVAQQIPYLINWLGSWQLAMTAVAGLGVIFWLMIIFFVKDSPAGRDAENAEEQAIIKASGFWLCLYQAFKNGQTWISGIYSNLLSIPVVVMGALWAKSYIHVVQHQSIEKADFIASMIFLGVLIGSPLCGWISDRCQQRRAPMIWGALLTLITSLIIILVHPLGFTTLMILFFLLGLFTGSQVITFALVIESNPKHLTASSESLAATIIMSAGAIFQPLFGYIMERNWDGIRVHHVAIYSTQAYEHAMWILPISFFVSLILAFFVKEPKRKFV